MRAALKVLLKADHADVGLPDGLLGCFAGTLLLTALSKDAEDAYGRHTRAWGDLATKIAIHGHQDGAG